MHLELAQNASEMRYVPSVFLPIGLGDKAMGWEYTWHCHRGRPLPETFRATECYSAIRSAASSQEPTYYRHRRPGGRHSQWHGQIRGCANTGGNCQDRLQME